MSGEMSWFYNMLINSNVHEYHASIATAVCAVLILLGTIKLITGAILRKR